MRDFFSLLPILLVFFIPAITMRLFAEEYSSGSFETIYTLPVSSFDIMGGKFLAALALVIVMLAPTLSYPLFIAALGSLDWGPVVGSYLGAILLAAVYTAVGIFTSSLTKNQIVAFISAMAICFVLYIINKILFLVPSFLAGFLQFLSADYHFRNIARGILDSRDIIYFLGAAILWLYAAHVVIQERQ